MKKRLRNIKKRRKRPYIASIYTAYAGHIPLDKQISNIYNICIPGEEYTGSKPLGGNVK